METNKFMLALQKLLHLIIRLAGANLLWLLFNIPVIIVCSTFLMSKSMNEAIFHAIVIAVLLPVFFFPATFAMFALIRKWIMEQEVNHVLSFYWKQYKNNYAAALTSGILLTIIWGIFIVDYYYVIQYAAAGFKYVILAFFVYFVIITAYYIANTVHFSISKIDAIKNAVLMTFKHPFLSMFTSLAAIFTALISFYAYVALLPFFTGSVIAYLSLKSFYRIIEKLTEAAEKSA